MCVLVLHYISLYGMAGTLDFSVLVIWLEVLSDAMTILTFIFMSN